VRTSIAAAVLCSAVLAQSPAVSPVMYAIDPAASTVRIHVGTAGVLGFLGHDHEIVAEKPEGIVRWAPTDPGQSSVEIVFDAAALRVVDPGVGEAKRAKIERDMKTKALEVETFPTIRFVSREVNLTPSSTGAGPYRGELTGELTLHGTTGPVEVPLELTLDGAQLRARGKVKLRGSRFGIDTVSAGAGTVKTKDELLLEFDVVAHQASPREGS
jgi:polyisoprenoid-binding protein YceI